MGLDCVRLNNSPKKIPTFQCLRPVTVTLYNRRDETGEMKQRILRLSKWARNAIIFTGRRQREIRQNCGSWKHLNVHRQRSG